MSFVISKRYSKANNRYLPDCKPKAEESYLMQWGANNLNGWVMMQTLPYKEMKFAQEVSLREILNTPDEGPVRYMVEGAFSLP